MGDFGEGVEQSEKRRRKKSNQKNILVERTEKKNFNSIFFM